MRKFQPNADTTKIGRKFYSCIAWRDDDGKGHVDIDVWYVRSIRKPNTRVYYGEKAKRVYLNRLSVWNRDKKGVWSKYIPMCDRKSFDLGGELPYTIFTTPLQALIDEREMIERHLKIYFDENCLAEEEQLLKLVKGRITRETNRAKEQRGKK